MSTQTAPAVAVSKTKTPKAEFVYAGKIGKRSVTSKSKGGASVTYSEVTLKDVSDPGEALTLLTLKGKRAVEAIVAGYNRGARRRSAQENRVAASVAEAKGISLEEARKLVFG